MGNYTTKIELFQGALPADKKYIFSKAVKQNKIIDTLQMTFKPECYIRKLSSLSYFNLKTMQEYEFMPKIDGKQMRSRRSLRKIFVDLRRLITTNFEGLPCEKFVTLTYSSQTNDPKKIMKDLDLFNKRFRHAYPNTGYIHIVEPHASGCFHIHSLLKNVNGETLNLTHKEIYPLWGHGYVTVEDLTNVDNIGAYFIAYFSNMEIDPDDYGKYLDDLKVMPKADGTGTKKVIKGKRLDFYPDFMKIYRNSKNLKKPSIVKDFDKNDYKKVFEGGYKITNSTDDGRITEMYINKAQFKQNPRP